jgi:hypothetical protein
MASGRALTDGVRAGGGSARRDGPMAGRTGAYAASSGRLFAGHQGGTIVESLLVAPGATDAYCDGLITT